MLNVCTAVGFTLSEGTDKEVGDCAISILPFEQEYF